MSEIKAGDHAIYWLRVGYNVTRKFQLQLQGLPHEHARWVEVS